MIPTVAAIPHVIPASLAGLLGPVAILAMISVVVTLGVLVTGLLMEQREVASPKLGGAGDRPPLCPLRLRNAA